MTSTIKVDNIQKVSDGSNIIKKCGSTITIGSCGQTVAIASGATTSGMGRTGTVDWQTSSIKTATFTAVSGEGYFCNTAGGTFEVDLPAGSAGAIVSVQDYNNTFDTNALSIDPNGSEKINGGTAGATLDLETEGQGVTFVYIDSTVGWRSIQSNELSSPGSDATYIVATGGTITTVDTNFKVHTFTSPGTFTVCSVGNPSGSDEVSYTVVAGGGGGAGGQPGSSDSGGAGGAGGYREGKSPQDSYTSSPITCTSGSNNGLTVTATGYPVVIGAGGAKGTAGVSGSAGAVSTFTGSTTITSAGGGLGRNNGGPGNRTGGNGGSGGGPSGGGTGMSGGVGNTPPVSPSQGFPGSAHAQSPDVYGGGGGGATAASADTGGAGNTGGAGATSSINGTPTARAGGGGGGGSPAGAGGTAGAGGGGAGAPAGNNATDGTANTGGGGGGGGSSGGNGGVGGSGIVMIRYKFQ